MYQDFFAFDEVAKINETYTQIRFYALSSEPIQFVLSEKNESLDTPSIIDSEPDEKRRGSYSLYSGHERRWHRNNDYEEYGTTTIPPPPPSTTTPANSKSDESYKFGILI